MNKKLMVYVAGSLLMLAGLTALISKVMADEPQDYVYVRCVEIRDGSQVTIFESQTVKSISSSHRDGEVVMTLYYDNARTKYELIHVTPNVGCSFTKVRKAL